MRAAAEVLAAPVLPQVDLLPPDVRQARALGLLRRRAVVALAGTTLVVGAVAAVAQWGAQGATGELARADAETVALLAELRPLADVAALRAELEGVRSARAHALAQEVLWSDRLAAVAAATPAGITIHELQYTGPAPSAAGAPPAGPSGQVGTIAFTARASGLTQAADWVDALDSIPGFGDVRMSTADVAGGDLAGYTVRGTIRVDQDALAHRFGTWPGGAS